METLGSLLGWLTVASLILTLMNFPIKRINKAAVARLPKESGPRKRLGAVTRFITGNHRNLAVTTFMLLTAHIVLQIIYRWISLSGLIAAGLLLVNVSLGAYGQYIRKRKRSAWFYIHRTIAALVTVAVIVHIAAFGLPALGGMQSSDGLTLTRQELSAFDGKDGRPAYVAVDGIVYDVSSLSRWLNGMHMNLHAAGEDLTEDLKQAPHSTAVLARARQVGVLVDD